MIVTCEKCNTAFDLDEELIQESGSEVKCSECENVFTVHKSTPVEESEPSLELEEDAVEISATEEPAEEEFDFEALGLEEKPEAEAPTETGEETVAEETPESEEEAPSEALDLEALGLEEKPEVEAPTETEEETVAEETPESEEEAPSEELDFEALGLEEKPEAEAPTETEEETVAEETPESEEEAPSEELDFEALGLEEKPEAEAPTETEEETVAEETPESEEEAPSEELDLEAISRAVEEAAEEPEPVSEEASGEEVLDFDLLEAEEPAAEKPAEEAMEFEELSVDEEPGAEEPAVVDEVPAVEEAPEPVWEEEMVEEAEAEEETEVGLVEEEPMPPPVAEQAPPEKKRLSASVMILLVFGLLAGGAFGAYVLLKEKVPFLQSLTGVPQPEAIDPGNLHITIMDEQITTEFLENSKAGRVFVIRGMVRNDYPESRNFIRVKGILYSQDGKAIAEKLSYCGNILSDKGLQTLHMATMDGKFQNRMGDDRSNFEIPAGKIVPFMVLFSDLAPDFAEYSVQVVGSAQAK